MQEKDTSKPECFVIMPISTPEGYSSGHFDRVYKDIFVPAIELAGFIPRRADDSRGTHMIQLEILRQLVDCPMVLCDLSSLNPNVMFELGLRQAFDKPAVLVRETGTKDIFDVSSFRYTEYRPARIYDEVLEDQKRISASLSETYSEWSSGKSVNSLVKLLSLESAATLDRQLEEDTSPVLQALFAEVRGLKMDLRSIRKGQSVKPVHQVDREDPKKSTGFTRGVL